MAIVRTTQASDLPGEVNVVYIRGLLSAARKVLPFFNGTRPGVLEKKGGSSTVLWRRIENLAAVTTALGQGSPGGTIAFGNSRDTVRPTYTNISKAVAKYANGITVVEEIDLFNIDSDTMALMDVHEGNWIAKYRHFSCPRQLFRHYSSGRGRGYSRFDWVYRSGAIRRLYRNSGRGIRSREWCTVGFDRDRSYPDRGRHNLDFQRLSRYFRGYQRCLHIVYLW